MTPSAHPLITVDEKIKRTTRLSPEDIASFARLSGDENPLHLDAQAAKRAGFSGVIASGQHTSALLMGMLATHFSRSDDGVARRMLCLNMNFAFKRPVFAEQDVDLQWRVSKVEWNRLLGGMLSHLDGYASIVPGHPSVIARGTILVSEARG
ncbi:MAG: MaoC family dehydratase [Burkholderiales bacterium]